LEKLERERIRHRPHPLGLISLLLAIMSGYGFFLAWTSPQFPANEYLLPALALSFLANSSGKMCQVLTDGNDDRGNLGTMVGLIIFLILTFSFLARGNRSDVSRLVGEFVGKKD